MYLATSGGVFYRFDMLLLPAQSGPASGPAVIIKTGNPSLQLSFSCDFSTLWAQGYPNNQWSTVDLGEFFVLLRGRREEKWERREEKKREEGENKRDGKILKRKKKTHSTLSTFSPPLLITSQQSRATSLPASSSPSPGRSMDSGTSAGRLAPVLDFQNSFALFFIFHLFFFQARPR